MPPQNRFSVVPGDDPAADVLADLAREFRAFANEVRERPKPAESDGITVPKWVAVSFLGLLLSAMVTVLSVVFVTNKGMETLETLHGAEQRANDNRFLRNEGEIRDIRNEVRALQQRGGNP